MPNDTAVLTDTDIPAEPAVPAATPQRKPIGLRAYAGTFATCVLIQGLTVVQGIIIARLLGPVGRGEYAAVILWPSIFAAVGIFGTNVALARAAATTTRYDQVIRTSILLALASGSVASVLCYLALPYLLPQASRHLLGLSRLFVAFILLNHLSLNVVAVDQGAGNFKRFNLTRMLQYPVYLAFLVAMWVWDVREIRWPVVGFLAATATVVVVRLILALKDMPLRGPLYSPRQTLRESVRFGLVGAAQPLYLHADKAILLWLLGAENLGLYVVALAASSATASITTSTATVTFTAAAQAKPGEGFERIARTFRISALLWLLFGGMLALAMGWLLPLVYGGEFAAAVNPARLLIVGLAFGGLAEILDQAMRGQGRPLAGLEARIVGLVAILVAGIVLSRSLGLLGMCLAYGTGQAICLTIFIWRVNRHFQAGHAYLEYVPQGRDARAFWVVVCRYGVPQK